MSDKAPRHLRHVRKEFAMNDHPSTERPIEKSATEARQGATTGTVRWVLAISLFGAIVALAVVWLAHGL
jgi:hypothetical protein